MISVKNKKDCMICTDMSEFCNMLEEEEQKQNKRKSKMKKKNRPTHADRKKFILDNKEKTLSSIHLSLLLQNKKISIMIIINSTFSPLSNNDNHSTI